MILFLGALLKEKYINKKKFIFVSFAIMTLVVGLRGSLVGEDTRHFIEVFEHARNISWKQALTSGTDVIYLSVYSVDLSIETGFLIYCKIIGLFTDNGQWMIFLSAVLTCYLFGKFIYDNIENPFMATYIFFCESLYMQLFNPLRQMLAISIALQGYKYIRKQNYGRALVYMAIAFLFHKASALLLILFFIFVTNGKAPPEND